MDSRRRFVQQAASVLMLAITVVASVGCSKKSSAETSSVDLQLDVKTPFHFVAYGDARFHDPRDIEPSDPAMRVALVKAIAEANPAFICFTGDLVYNGFDASDWKVWDSETNVWHEKKILVYPTLGNHELRGDARIGLENYFRRFPSLKNSRYYSVRAANTLILALDSSLDEVAGSQGVWLAAKLDHVPADVDFVFLMLHHPLYTSSSDASRIAGGHSARASEQALAKMLETRQAHASYRIVVFSGHVHNYERHEHNGVTYFVSGGGGAHPYPMQRAPDDLFQSNGVNYHYLAVEVGSKLVTIVMNRLDLTTGKAVWTQPDTVKISVPAAVAAQAAGH